MKRLYMNMLHTAGTSVVILNFRKVSTTSQQGELNDQTLQGIADVSQCCVYDSAKLL